MTAIFALVAAIGGILAAIAGGYQGWVARDAEIVSNRAIILSNSFRLITYDAPVEGDDSAGSGPRRWAVTERIENVGVTPTRQARYTAGVTLGELDDAKFERFTNKSLVPISIGPRSEVNPSVFMFTNSNFDIPFGGWGLVKYWDIFGKPHITEFCYSARAPIYVNFHASPAAQPIYVPGTPCAHHNCADEECGSDWEKRAKE